ncbi:MAG: hypothetical protein IPP17_19410 [Bacteroidetes bacterium]|nr:hypothetical protein [Bacteroidota bacterium]
MVRLGGTFDPGVSLQGTQLYRYTNGGIRDTLYDGTGKCQTAEQNGIQIYLCETNKWMIPVQMLDPPKIGSKFKFFDRHTPPQFDRVNVGNEWILS